MSGKHSRPPRPAKGHATGGIKRFRRGAVELVTLGVLGVALPLAAFTSLPHFFDSGTAMVGAPTCAANAADVSDCLVAVPATAKSRSGTLAQDWSFTLAGAVPAGRNIDKDRTTAELSFPRFGTSLTAGADGHVLLWHGDAVAFSTSSNEVVESLDWGRLYTVNFRILVLVPVWVVTAAILAHLVIRRRHSAMALVLRIVALGAVTAAPGAWIGLQLFGLRGLVTGGIAPLGLSLVLAGLALAQRRRSARRAVPRRVLLPKQRHPVANYVPSQRSGPSEVDEQVNAEH